MARVDRAGKMDWKQTPSDIARMNAAIAARDKRVAIERMKERLARLAVCAIAIFLGVAMFYGATGGIG